MRNIFSVIGAVFLIILFQCTSKENANSSIEGSWNAEWLLMDNSLADIYPPENLIMNGEILFNPSNSANIKAFGYEGCVFASDTAENELKYEFTDSLLNMINDNNEVVFSYLIKERLTNQISLEMMEDIKLTLRRQ